MRIMTLNKLQIPRYMCDTHFQGITDNVYTFGRLFSLFFNPSSDISAHPNDGWTGLHKALAKPGKTAKHY